MKCLAKLKSIMWWAIATFFGRPNLEAWDGVIRGIGLPSSMNTAMYVKRVSQVKWRSVDTTGMVILIQFSSWAIGKMTRPQKPSSPNIGVGRVMWPFKMKMGTFGIKVELTTCSKRRATELAQARLRIALSNTLRLSMRLWCPNPMQTEGPSLKLMWFCPRIFSAFVRRAKTCHCLSKK